MLDLSEAGRQAIARHYGDSCQPSGVTIAGDLDPRLARCASALWTELLLDGDPPSGWLDQPEYWVTRLYSS